MERQGGRSFGKTPKLSTLKIAVERFGLEKFVHVCVCVYAAKKAVSLSCRVSLR